MGGCLSTCRTHKSRVTEVLVLSAPAAGVLKNNHSVPSGSLAADTEAGGQLFRKTKLGKQIEKDARRADIKRRWHHRYRQRIVVSPMHDDNTQPIVVQRFSNAQSHFVGTTSVSSKKGKEKCAEDGRTVKPVSGTSQPVDSKAEPKKTVNANIRTLKFIRARNENADSSEQLEIIEVVEEDEPILVKDSFLPNATSSQNVVEEDVEALPRPMTAHQKRLGEKHSREAAAFENIAIEGKAIEITKEPEDTSPDAKSVKVPGKNGPKVTLINVRPKTPECAKIEIVPQPKATKDSFLGKEKPKELMVPKQSERTSLDKDNGGTSQILTKKFAEETASESSSDPDDVPSAVPGHVQEAPDPVQGPAGEFAANAWEKPKKPKKKRPVKLYPYTKGRMIPQLPYPEEPWLTCPKPASKKSQPTAKDYEEFDNRFLKPSQKARATEGKILDGTLITWPKYLKNHEKDGDDAIATRIPVKHKLKMAWGGEPIQERPPAPAPPPDPVVYTSSRLSPTICLPTDTHSLSSQRNLQGGMKTLTKSDSRKAKQPTSKVTSDQSQAKRFVYKAPPPSFGRRNDGPYFAEKKLSFTPSTPPESSEDEDIMNFVFTPENLRRYARRKRAKLQRRPKTPFNVKRGTATKGPGAEHHTRSKPTPGSIPNPETQGQSSNHVYKLGPKISNETGRKSVTFVIPLEGTRARQSSSRPNTRRQMRPMTPRATAGELALRQENAQRRREKVMKSRIHGLGKKHEHQETCRRKKEREKKQQLMDKVDEKMKKHGENRKKKLEDIVAKQAEHNEQVQRKHDVIYQRRRLFGSEQESSCVSNAQFTIGDLLEIDRFFAELD